MNHKNLKLFRIAMVMILLLAIASVNAQQKEIKEQAARWSTLILDKTDTKGNWISYRKRYEMADTLFICHTTSGKTQAFAGATQGIFTQENFICLLPGNAVSITNLESGHQEILENVFQFQPLANNGLLLERSENGTNKILELRDDRGKLNRILNVSAYSISPDGNKIIYGTTNGGLYLLSVLGKPTTIKIGGTARNVGNFFWQPNGQSIAWTATEMANTKLYLYRITRKTLLTFDPKTNPDFASDRKISPQQFKRATLSQDGKRVFFSMEYKQEQEANPKAVKVYNDTDVWMPEKRSQLSSAATIGIWSPDKGTFQRITNTDKSELMLSGDQRFALVFSPIGKTKSYMQTDNTDYFLTNLESGKTELLLSQLPADMRTVTASPAGKYFIYYKNYDWWSYDLSIKMHRCLTESLGNDWSAQAGEAGERSVFGIAGFTASDRSVVVYSSNDLWEIPLGGGPAKRLTHGKEKGMVLRLALQNGTADRTINYNGGIWPVLDLKNGLILSAHSENNGQNGLFRWTPKNGEKQITYGDFATRQIIWTSDKTAVFYTIERFDSPPAIKKWGPEMKPQVVVQGNAQHSKFNWGRAELIRYSNSKGQSAKAVLYYPASYDPNKKYPMLVHIYEQLSYAMHHYVNPSMANPDGINIANLTMAGYLVLCPDIIYEIGDPGVSATDCIVSATAEVVNKGIADPKRIALEGHSFGGYETNFIITQTNIFAAAISGSGMSDLTAGYLGLCENDGMPDLWRYESQQMRMGKSLYEDIDAYDRNSPVRHAEKVTTPLLLWTGGDDPQVNKNQTFEFYLALRRLDKKTKMLEFPNEGHVLTDYDNQKELTGMIADWLGHYLNEEPPAAWMVP